MARLAHKVLQPAPRYADCTPLVMIQGWTAVKEDWHGFERLFSKRPVLIFDNRGMGESKSSSSVARNDVSAEESKKKVAKPKLLFTMKDLAQDVVRLIEQVFPSRVVDVMGVSMGGMIAQEVALLLTPQKKLGRLVLGCCHHGGPGVVAGGAEFVKRLTKLLSGNVNVDSQDELVSHLSQMQALMYTPDWVKLNPEKFQQSVMDRLRYARPIKIGMAQFLAIRSFNAERRLSQIQVPTLIVHGDRDQVMPFGNATKIGGLIPNSQVLTLPNIGHAFWDMAPDTSKVIERFLDGENVQIRSNLYYLQFTELNN
eukprot:TRINITY_DN660_c0_g1_i1.p1 TRINITY_DN660_c0_g1~~TRINITY_DN660_c0_g1_i1.p1  ORF type:complete len:312 (-),score=53.50 TRINITY_DN660_c0_g1_i1:63-998(-)